MDADRYGVPYSFRPANGYRVPNELWESAAGLSARSAQEMVYAACSVYFTGELPSSTSKKVRDRLDGWVSRVGMARKRAYEKACAKGSADAVEDACSAPTARVESAYSESRASSSGASAGYALDRYSCGNVVADSAVNSVVDSGDGYSYLNSQNSTAHSDRYGIPPVGVETAQFYADDVPF